MYYTRLKEEVNEGSNSEFSLSSDGVLKFKGRLCVSNDEELQTQILTEAQATLYLVHPGAKNMYRDLK